MAKANFTRTFQMEIAGPAEVVPSVHEDERASCAVSARLGRAAGAASGAGAAPGQGGVRRNECERAARRWE